TTCTSSAHFIPRHPLRPCHFPYTPLFRSQLRRAQLKPHDKGRGRTHSRSVPHLRTRIACRAGLPALDPEEEGHRGRRCGGEGARSEEQTSELQSLRHLVCRLLLEKKKKKA